jgi:hypothetical protein
VLKAHRFNDSTGVQLTVRLTTDFEHQRGSQKDGAPTNA